MEKRLVLAIALSLLVLLSWSALAPKSQLLDNKGVIADSTQVKVPIQQGSSGNQASTLTQFVSDSISDPIKEVVKFTQDNRDIIFDPARATIIEVVFKNRLEHHLPLKIGLLSDNGNLFKQESMTKEQISFIYQDQNKRIVKKFIIPNDSYAIELEIKTQNLSPSPLSVHPQLVLGRLDLSAKNTQSRYQDILLSGKEKTMHISAGKDFATKDVKFIGLRDQYFCAILEPVDTVDSAYIKKISPQESELGILGSELSLNPGKQIGHLYHIYLGPQDLKTINSIKTEWTAIIYYGTFDFIAQLLLQLLGFFYSLVHNWGWAIIILSLAVYLLLFPLSLKQMRSMKEMQALQPKIEALRKELKDNPQRLNKEIMELYKEHKVNPLGGCLPLLLQMPIFFALYQALIRSVALRGAHFLWIKDLSSPDQLFTFKNSIPILGNQVNILPILMAIGMFVQQKISTIKTTGDAAQQQKMMSIIMPVMFGVIFYHMPSGLVLYWFVNSTLMLLYQVRMNKQK
ncbi:MAG: membrane protein insertase YidC [Candidatus Omnitrophica bacterium]|nr:membrane protein insertase YidC [Candidatus Omnitrophota bacterium]MBU1923404.1 membrane protein insertase YidC [Candidatus Omnitrophota bacterium]